MCVHFGLHTSTHMDTCTDMYTLYTYGLGYIYAHATTGLSDRMTNDAQDYNMYVHVCAYGAYMCMDRHTFICMYIYIYA